MEYAQTIANFIISTMIPIGERRRSFIEPNKDGSGHSDESLPFFLKDEPKPHEHKDRPSER